MNFFHWGSLFGHKGPTAFHKVPQVVRDMGRSRGVPSVVDLPVNDLSPTIEVGPGWGLCDKFEYQQCE